MITFDPDALAARLSELDSAMESPGFWEDQRAAAKVAAERARTQKKIETFEQLEADSGELDFMLEQARCFPDMIEMYKRLKAKHGLRVVVVSNEGRELTKDRIRRFNLKDFVDIFVVSSYVHFRKPDEDIFHIALDVAQAEPEEVVYVDDRHMFAEVACRLGMHEIWHRDLDGTRAAFEALGLSV